MDFTWKTQDRGMSRSSPSPPPQRPGALGQDGLRKRSSGRGQSRRRLSTAAQDASSKPGLPPNTSLDWSTSYQAGSSGSDSNLISDDDETDDDPPEAFRGRRFSQPARYSPAQSRRSLSKHHSTKTDSSQNQDSELLDENDEIAAVGSLRSAPRTVGLKAPYKIQRPSSPSLLTRVANAYTAPLRNLLTHQIQFQLSIPCTHYTWVFCADSKMAGENVLLLASAAYAVWRLLHSDTTNSTYTQYNSWTCFEFASLIISSFCYMLWNLSNLVSTKPIDPASVPLAPSSEARPSSPRISEGRDANKKLSSAYFKKKGFGFIWMSVPKNYRESTDDGVFTGLLLGPIIAASLLFTSLQSYQIDQPPLKGWIIEGPTFLQNPSSPPSPLHALILARYSLVDLACFCSTMLLLHVSASWWYEARTRTWSSGPEGERSSVPRSEARRSYLYIIFTLGVAVSAVILRTLLLALRIGIWQHLNYFELIFASLFYQFTLYVALRLAHRGFTLGELSLVCFGGTVLGLETLNLTFARIWPVTTAFVKTYRLPTPLLVFQAALVVGAFLTGFLLSPFLVLSRHTAQRPVRRLKHPEERTRQRRYLALGFYAGSFIIIFGMIGMWTRWCLGKRDPWLWAIFWVMQGKRKWSRLTYLGYCALLGVLSVVIWNRQLARIRRYRGPWSGGDTTVPSPAYDSTSNQTDKALLISPYTFPGLSNGSQMATDFLDAANKHVPTLSLNARRKSFHALAVAMFIPGVAFDPAFSHLAFSAAFSLFIFAEYVRYFAIYPFGASVHLFMNEFLDSKDSGTAILSHFYLLTGCAGSIWLEGNTRILHFTGILTLGVGDAVASIVGKRLGRYKWSPTTSKTLEGSVAFTISTVMCAIILQLFGLSDSFSVVKYTVVIASSSILEALSVQNDNLTLPLYSWSMLVLSGI